MMELKLVMDGAASRELSVLLCRSFRMQYDNYAMCKG